jgi:DNA primase
MTAEELFAELLTKEAQPKRWHEVLIHHPHRQLTKQQIFNYYSQDRVRNTILAQIKKSPTLIQQQFSPDKPVLKRWESGKPIHIKRDAGDVNSPNDYQYWIERRATEFHPTIGPKTSKIWLDIDPTEGFPWEKTKELVHLLADKIDNEPGINATHIQFSGGRGFYIIGELSKEIPTDEARKWANDIARPFTEDPSITMDIPTPGELRIDTSTLKNTGSIRGLYSLNSKTGLISIPVEREWLSSFNKEDATIKSVLGYTPKNEKSFRV